MADQIYEHGTQMELHRESGFAPEDIAQAVEKILENVKVKVL